jgi:predicted enzyme related to lactoylglutathione lyase
MFESGLWPVMVKRTIVHFEIPAGDPARLSKFYSEAFGWKFEAVKMPGMDYWMISTGPRGKSVGGGMYKKTEPQDTPRNYIGVENIDKAIEVFTKAGGREVIGKQEVPGQGWSYIGLDPEGNAIAIWQPMVAPRRKRRR